eukprot:469198_1
MDTLLFKNRDNYPDQITATLRVEPDNATLKQKEPKYQFEDDEDDPFDKYPFEDDEGDADDSLDTYPFENVAHEDDTLIFIAIAGAELIDIKQCIYRCIINWYIMCIYSLLCGGSAIDSLLSIGLAIGRFIFEDDVFKDGSFEADPIKDDESKPFDILKTMNIHLEMKSIYHAISHIHNYQSKIATPIQHYHTVTLHLRRSVVVSIFSSNEDWI